MEAAYRAGKAHAIGVSDFYPSRLSGLCMNVRLKPAVNRIECHPFCQKERNLALMREFGAAPAAWAPFAEEIHDI